MVEKTIRKPMLCPVPLVVNPCRPTLEMAMTHVPVWKEWSV